MNENSIKIFYWAPFIDHVATIKAVINSAHSVKKFSANKVPYIIDVFGEWLPYYQEINNKEIKIIKLYEFNLKKFLPKGGFIQSRISYIAVELPRKVTAILRPLGGISQTADLILFGIHSTK